MPGPKFVVQGAVQQAGDTVRVTARVVSVETSEVLGSGKGDGHSVYEAAREALAKLGPLADVPEPSTGG